MPSEDDNEIESMETSFGSHSLEPDEREQIRAAHKQLRERRERANRVLSDELTKKLDHILYTEWDPIGVHFLEEFDCFDEYHRYLPEIVELVRAGASLSAISDQLMLVESYMRGDDSIRRRCDVVAVMVSSYGPHYSKNPITPIVNTDTPENAYQSVLDLVTQTRLDAYENNWDAVRMGYEKAIDVCSAFLPERDVLLGACLNNLGHAYSKLGQLEKAQAQFEKALPKLELQSSSEEPQYLLCLNNLVSNLEYRREFAASVPFVKALISYRERTVGADDEKTEDAKERLEKLGMIEQVPVSLWCTRISVERDGCGHIQNAIMIE